MNLALNLFKFYAVHRCFRAIRECFFSSHQNFSLKGHLSTRPGRERCTWPRMAWKRTNARAMKLGLWMFWSADCDEVRSSSSSYHPWLTRIAYLIRHFLSFLFLLSNTKKLPRIYGFITKCWCRLLYIVVYLLFLLWFCLVLILYFLWPFIF